MKTLKTILCLLLVASLLAGFCVCFADGGKDYSGYRKYVSLGDSIANGIGENNVENKYMNRTPGAYPDRIANEIGADLTQLACGGMRTVELRACLEDDYVMPDELANNFSREKVQEIRSLYAPAIADADFITLNIGSNDILTYAILRAKEALAKSGISLGAASSDEANGDFSGALGDILGTAEGVGMLADIVKDVVDGIYDGYTHFCKNWDAIIGDIYALNPNATLMVSGLYNPFPELKISDSSVLPLGKAADAVIELINMHIKNNSAYADKYIYVDIMGVESMATKFGDSITDEGFFKSVELNVHPSNEGQAEIAKRFIALIPECSGAPFTDIAAKPLNFRDAIDWAYAEGITNGKTAGSFCPDDSCTRGQIITMLWRAAGSPAASSACGFSDVSSSSYCYSAVCWAVGKGIAKGFTSTQFCPEKTCTRGQIVTFLYRYAGSPAGGSTGFTDVAKTSYCYDAVCWAVENGIAKGFDSTHFAPDSFCTRAQSVTFLYRFMA